MKSTWTAGYGVCMVSKNMYLIYLIFEFVNYANKEKQGFTQPEHRQQIEWVQQGLHFNPQWRHLTFFCCQTLLLLSFLIILLCFFVFL